jgi:hypothetical protein
MGSYIYVPSAIAVEVAPVFLFRDLAIQSDTMTPSTMGSSIMTTPSQNVSSSDRARSLARILHAHYGTIPRGFDDLLAGGVTYVNGVKNVSAEGRTFKDKTLPNTISTTLNEKTGKGSYFQAFVKGMVSSENCKVNINDSVLVDGALTSMHSSWLSITLWKRTSAQCP